MARQTLLLGSQDVASGSMKPILSRLIRLARLASLRADVIWPWIDNFIDAAGVASDWDSVVDTSFLEFSGRCIPSPQVFNEPQSVLGQLVALDSTVGP